MRPIKLIYFLLPLLGVSQGRMQDSNLADKLFICYGKVNPELVRGYELVIIESAHYSSSEIAVFNENNKKVVAYLSISEVNENASFYKDIEPFTLGKNETWNSRFIDIQSKKAQGILNNVINKMKQKGVQGLFLDNLDNVSKWGKLRNQKEAFITFLGNLKNQNEDLYLVQNAGLFMAKELKDITDGIVVESIASSYNFNKNTYELRDSISKKQRIKEVQRTKNISSKPIYIIEYAETSAMKKYILEEIKKWNLSVFVGQIDLQSIPKFKL